MRYLVYEKIWKKSLSADEEVLHEFSVSDRYRYFNIFTMGLLVIIGSIPGFFWSPFFVLLLFLVPVFIISCIYYGLIMKLSNAFAFTDKRVVVHKGWLNTCMTSAEYDKITDVSVTEGFVEKIITHSGTLLINTAGTTFHELPLEHVESPYELKKKLDSIMSGKLEKKAE